MRGSREIPLTQGLVAIVDDEDYDWLSEAKWYAKRNREFYAARNVPTGLERPKQRTLLMHQAVWEHHNGPVPDHHQIDHADRDTLNDSLSNLRLATYCQQAQNRRVRSNNTSGYRGVGWWRRSEKWVATITVGGKRIWLGYFTDPAEAARAYDAAARVHHDPEFAQLNFP